MSSLPTTLLMSWEDIGTDHPDVPAMILLSGHGTWLTQEPPRRFSANFHVNLMSLFCAGTVFAICTFQP